MVSGMALAGLGDFGEDEGIQSGTDSDDTLMGSEGDDQTGGEGLDTLIGGASHDLLDGRELSEAAKDFLNGGQVDDTIFAGSGDVVDGGDGADTTVIGNWISSTEPAQIKGFNVNEDQLEISVDTVSPEVTITEVETGLYEVMCDNELLAQVSTIGELTSSNVIIARPGV